MTVKTTAVSKNTGTEYLQHMDTVSHLLLVPFSRHTNPAHCGNYCGLSMPQRQKYISKHKSVTPTKRSYRWPPHSQIFHTSDLTSSLIHRTWSMCTCTHMHTHTHTHTHMHTHPHTHTHTHTHTHIYIYRHVLFPAWRNAPCDLQTTKVPRCGFILLYFFVLRFIHYFIY